MIIAQKGFDEFISLYFEKIITYHPFALCVCMYIGIRKTSLLIEFCTHYSLLWFNFQRLDVWEEGLELRMVDGLAKFLNYYAV